MAGAGVVAARSRSRSWWWQAQGSARRRQQQQEGWRRRRLPGPEEPTDGSCELPRRQTRCQQEVVAAAARSRAWAVARRAERTREITTNPVLVLGAVRLLDALGTSAILVVVDSYAGLETVIEVARTLIGSGGAPPFRETG